MRWPFVSLPLQDGQQRVLTMDLFVNIDGIGLLPYRFMIGLHCPFTNSTNSKLVMVISSVNFAICISFIQKKSSATFPRRTGLGKPKGKPLSFYYQNSGYDACDCILTRIRQANILFSSPSHDEFAQFRYFGHGHFAGSSENNINPVPIQCW